MTTVQIALSSGQTVELVYQWTFGGMAIVALLIVLDVLYAARWVYDLMRPA